MRYPILLAIASVTMLTACGQQSQPSTEPGDSPQAEFGFMEAMDSGPEIVPPTAPERAVVERVSVVDIEESAAEASGMGEAANEQMPEGMPQIAYKYDYGFRIGTDKLTALQQQHADLCVSKGPNVCRLISMNQHGSTGDYAYGRLRIEVIADQARDFGMQLAGAAEGAGGEQTSSSISGEDLSKQIVDTEARLRARTLLRDRLMEILRSRNGTVAELVEAERGVAQVNEEIDQARSWLAAMRGRVAFSDVTIDYESGSPSAGGFWEPISWALGAAGSAAGRGIGTVIMLIATLLPWVLLIGGGIWVWRRAGFPWWKKSRTADDAENASAE